MIAGRGLRAAVLVAAALAAACGKKGPARAPEPRGPLPPGDVVARQLGTRVEVAFTVPKPRGDRAGQEPARAELLRVTYAPGLLPPSDPDVFRRRGDVVPVEREGSLASGERVSIPDAGIASLEGSGVGWTLRYGVRVRDRRGRASPLVVAPDLKLEAAPPAPAGLKAEATADGVRLTWTPPAEGVKLKYNVYRAAEGEPLAERPLHGEPLAATEFLDSTAQMGRTYAYEVRVALADGRPYRESEPSARVGVAAEDRFPPAAPTGLVVVQEGAAARLFWDPSQERDLAGYRVYRSTAGSGWTRIGPDPVREPLFLDPAIREGERFEYRVTALDRAANEGPPSETVDLTPVQDPVTGGRPGR